MAAGLATLTVLEQSQGWQRLEAIGAQLEGLLAPVLARAPFPITLVRAGSLFWLALNEGGPPVSAASLSERESARFAALFHAMLERGVYLPPSAYEACFLSLAHAPADLEEFAAALAASLSAVASP